MKALKLAKHFASSARADGAVQDAFFEPAGQDLLAGMLLATALQHRPIPQAFTWLSAPTNQEPVDVLRGWDYDLIAADLQGVIMSPEKQRGGAYGPARQMASCLKIRAIERWVAPVGATSAAIVGRSSIRMLSCAARALSTRSPKRARAALALW